MIFSRAGSKLSGHVTFYTGAGQHDADAYSCLGGNQGDKVCVVDEPAFRLLGIRWPTAYDALT